MLALLLAAALPVCPTSFLHKEFRRAVHEQRITMDLWVMPGIYDSVPLNALLDAPGRPAYAWIYEDRWWDNTIRVRWDVMQNGSCRLFTMLAYHEVCHVALGHHLTKGVMTPAEQQQQEADVDTCMAQYLSPAQLQSMSQDMDAILPIVLKNIEPEWSEVLFRVKIAP